jgi:hypothetical protein
MDRTSRRVVAVVPVVLVASAVVTALAAMSGCEERVVGARGPGAGFYRVQEPMVKDDSSNVYGEAGLPQNKK